MIKQKFYHYTLWEDWQNGMFKVVELDYDLIKKAFLLLSDIIELQKIMYQVLDSWPISAEVNLTNTSCNRRAWLGQSACCFKYKVPEILTRIAWGQLTEDQKDKANQVANDIIDEWELNYIRGIKSAQTCIRF